MSDVVFKLVADPSLFIAGVQKADNAQTELNREVEETGKLAKKTYNDAANSTAGLTKETEKANDKTKTLKAQYRELKAQLADATDPDDIIRLSREAGKLADQIGDANEAAAIFATESPFEAIGNSIGGVIGKLRNLDFKGAADQSKLLVSASKSLTFKEGIQGVKDLGTTLVNMGKSLLMNPIFLLGTALTLIISNFDELKNSGGAIGGFFKGISGAVDGLRDGLVKLTDYVGLTNKAFQKLNETKLNNLAEQLETGNAKFDAYINLVKAYGKETIAVEKAKQDFIIKNSFEQLAIIEKLVRANGSATDEQKKQIKELRDAAFGASNQKAILEAQAQQKIVDEQKKAIEKQKKAADELAQALLDLLKKSQSAELSMLSGKEKLDFQKKLSDQEVAELEKTIKKKLQATGKGNKLSAEQEQEFANIRKAINTEYYNGILQLSIQAAQAEAQINKNKNDTALQNLEYENTIVKNGIENVKAAQGASAREIEALNEEKNIMLLKQELEYQLEKEALVIKGIEAERQIKVNALQAELTIVSQKEDAVSKARAKAITDEINAINQNSELAKAAAMTSAQNVINGIQEQLNKPKRKIDLSKLLGFDSAEIAYAVKLKFDVDIDQEKVDSAKQALQGMVNDLKKIVDSYFENQEKVLDKEIENNNKVIELRNINISSLQSQLEKENELRNNGLANDVDRLNDAIEAEKIAKQKALDEEKKLKEEKRKLAKQQLDIDTALQASQIILAIAQLYGSLSGFTVGPIPVGLIIATAASAALVAGFASQTANAYDAVNKKEGSFEKGGYTGDGGKYEEAGTVHKGEFVTTKEKTKKYRNLLEGIHQNDNLLIEKGISELLENTGVSLSGLPKELMDKKSVIRQAEYAMNFNGNNSGVEKRLDTLSTKFDALNSGLKDSETYLEDGTRIIKRGYNTTIIRKR